MCICPTDRKESTWFHNYLAKKEAKRLEKEAKLAAKAAKAVATTPAGEKKVKEKAAKDQVVPFVNTTPKGHKKGEFVLRWTDTWSYCTGRTLTLGIEWNSFPRSAMLIRCLCRLVGAHGRRLRSDCCRSRLVRLVARARFLQARACPRRRTQTRRSVRDIRAAAERDRKPAHRPCAHDRHPGWARAMVSG